VTRSQEQQERCGPFLGTGHPWWAVMRYIIWKVEKVRLLKVNFLVLAILVVREGEDKRNHFGIRNFNNTKCKFLLLYFKTMFKFAVPMKWKNKQTKNQ
jgi:hypothetical protein